MSELVKRLRDAGKNLVVVGHTKRALCAEAADRIEALEAENARQKQALQQARSALHRHAMLPWGQPDYPTPTPGAALLYEARSYLDAALKDHP